MTKLTANFSSDELNVTDAPANVRANALLLSQLLERVRTLAGNVPLVVTSGYRPGDARQHGTGSAADLRVPNRDPIAFVNRVAPGLPASAFGQMIAYPWTTKHVHIALPNGANRGDIRVETGKGKYTPWTPGTPVPAWGAGGTASGDASPTEGKATIDGMLILLGLVMFIFLLLGS